MFHERMLYNSPLVTIPERAARAQPSGSLVHALRDAGRLDDPVARDLVGEARMLQVVGDALQDRIRRGVTSGAMTDQSAAVGRLFAGIASARTNTIMFELAGAAGAAWTDDDGALEGTGIDFIMRQVSCIGGGTTEMARNVISERVLGMPRERTVDRDVPFRDIPRAPAPGARG